MRSERDGATGWLGEWPAVRLPSFVARTVRITDFGAVPGGRFMNTEAFARAIETCAGLGGGTVAVPKGLWLSGPIQLQSGINLHLEKGALIQFSPRYEDYPLVRANYEGTSGIRCVAPLHGRHLKNVAITGEGILDGAGQAWRPVKRAKMTEAQWKALVASGGAVDEVNKIWWPSAQALNGRRLIEELSARGDDVPLAAFAGAREYLRPVLLDLVECRQVLLDGPTFQNSPNWCLHPLLCEDLTICRVTVRNPWWAQNGDGLDLDSCRNVLVADSVFDVGDDAICLKSGKDEAGRRRGRPTENVTVHDCLVYHGHGGFSIGSEMSGGVRNIKVSDCTFIGTDMGLRIKSARGRGGTVENINIIGIKMIDIKNEAITFDLYYGLKDAAEKTEEVNETTPRLRDIHLRDIVCRGAGRAMLARGLPEMPIRGLTLENVSLAARTGVSLTDVDHAVLESMEIVTEAGPIAVVRNGRDITLDAVVCPVGAAPFLRLSGPRTNGIKIDGTAIEKAATLLELSEDVPPDAVKFA